MRLVVLFALVGCSAPARDTPVDAQAVDAPPVDPPLERRVHHVLVGETEIIWAHGSFPPCSLEFGCSTRGPSLTYWSRAARMVSNRVENGTGSLRLAGSEASFFVVGGPDHDQMYLRRLDGGTGVSLSVPHALTVGPAVDDTHVYWGEAATNGGVYSLYRALRTGDGSDRSLVATTTTTAPPEQLTYAAGYLWWLDPATSQRITRVPITGGAIETLSVSSETLVAYDDVVYASSARSNGDGTWTSEVGHLDGNGGFEATAEQTSNDGAVARYIVKAADGLYWSTNDGNVYRTDLAGGAIETIAAHDTAGYAFAVLPGEILVEFTRSGFRSIPR